MLFAFHPSKPISGDSFECKLRGDNRDRALAPGTDLEAVDTLANQDSSRPASGAGWVRRAGWFAAAAAAGIVFFILGLLLRVLVGPVSLGPFTGELRSALREGLPGLDINFDNAALEWTPDEGRVDLVILGTRIFDQHDRIIAQAPKAEIGLGAVALLRGAVVVKRITLVGVQLTLVHTRDGTLRLGVGRAAGQNDVLQRIRDAISHGNGSGSLQSFAVHRARLAFYDEETGAFVVAPGAELQVTTPDTSDARRSGLLTANVSAQIEISGRPAHVSATVNLPRQAGLVTGDVSVSGLDLSALGRNAQAFRFLSPLAMTADVTASLSLVNGTSLHFADFGVAASGTVNGFGPPLHVKLVRLVGRYDGQSHRLIIDDGTLEGAQARAHFEGSAALSLDATGALRSSSFDVAADKLMVDVPGATAGAVSVARLDVQGVYSGDNRCLVLDRVRLSGGPLSAAFAGKAFFAPAQSPEIDADGKMDAISVRDLLRYWPLRVVPGGRAWIDANVPAGRLGPVLIHTHIPAGALDRSPLPDNAISVSFPLIGASFVYLRGLTPVTNAVGSATLSGDTFKADFSSAAAGPLAVSRGQVVIPNLHVHGTPASISAHVEGALPQVLALLDMKPLQYPTRFHINPASTRGTSKVDLAVRVPTVRGVRMEDVSISAKGTVGGLAMSLGPHTAVTDGDLGLEIDNQHLHATGSVALGTADLAVDWLETFHASDAMTTQVALRGTLNDAARRALSLPGSTFLNGPVGAVATLKGHRGSIAEAVIDLDLTSSAFGFDPIGWNKPPGVAASAHIAARIDQNGDFRSADMSLNGTGMTVRGTASLAAGGVLQSLDLPTVHLGPDNDFSAVVQERPGAGLDIAVSGRSLDASNIGKPAPKPVTPDKAAEPGEPFHLAVKVDRLALRNGVWVAPFELDANGAGHRLRTLTASGSILKAAPFTASMTQEASQRSVAITTADAGLLVKGLLGFESVKGGALSLHATLPASTARADHNAPDYSGELTIKDCTILNQPFLTRLFSAGSFGGFLDLMRGQGIALSTLEVPFRVNGNVVSIHDARASGPSIGVTADGYVDRGANQIALQGAMAPLYGINSVLGAIPLVGNVFVSKKGEGLFGVTYSLRGDLDEPRVMVNPLSVLTPGILRRVFEGGAPVAPSQTVNAPPSLPGHSP